MGCECSSSTKENKEGVRTINSMGNRNNLNQNMSNNQNISNQNNNNMTSNQNNNQNNNNNNNLRNNNVNRNMNNRENQNTMILNSNQVVNNRVGYIPYLQADNDPSFNMKEVNVVVGQGFKKMNGYECNIEMDELVKKRKDFWDSMFSGSKDVWELLRNFCEGDFEPNELKELMTASELTTYKGCINVVYDAKGNMYEIPNYCIHDPVSWNIPKYTIKKPDEKKVRIIIRNGIVDLKVDTTNLCPIKELAQYVVKKFPFDKIDKSIKISGTIKDSQLRFFHYGKEFKQNDLLYMLQVDNESIILMMIKQDI